jgi:beta-lactamase class A
MPKAYGFIGISVAVVSIIVNILFFVKLSQGDKSSALREKFPLLAPRILTENPTDTLINFLPLRTQLRDMVAPYGETFAFFFEYLPTGTSIGVNEKLPFTAASLIKVPGIMAYYRQMENNGFSLDGQAVRIQEKHIDKGFGSLWMRGVGATVSLDEAVRLALIESDNTASYIVADNVARKHFEEVYEGLDIDLMKESGKIDISAKSYISIFKALYFAAILTKEHSQEILDMLSQTRFNDKLVAGVPQGVKVSHKIGVYAGENIFQDCGIVYVPSRPYALCMISKAAESETNDRMKKVSATVYQYVTQANKHDK